MVLNHPATTQETRDMATKTLDLLKATQPAETVDAATAAGKDLPFEQVVKDILA